jgi:hypothetical protein
MWKFSSIVYKEVSFQSIFSMRLGSTLPQRGRTDVKRLVRNARTNTLISKLITTVFIIIFGFTTFLPMAVSLPSTPAPRELTMIGSTSAYLAVVLFLIVFMGLQVSTSFVSTKAADMLGSLPLSKQEISNIIFLSFLRMFDIPLLAAIAAFPLAYFLVGGTVLGGLISLVAIAVTEMFALALTVGLARLFYSRVAGGGGRSRWQTFLRLVFMLVWIIPTFAAYLVVNFAQTIVQSFASLAQALESVLRVVVVLYPFSYGFLVSYATSPKTTDYLVIGLSITFSVLYAFAAGLCLRWVTGVVRKISSGLVTARLREIVKDTLIRPQNPWLGTLRKDLRIASRAPSFASLFLLPGMQTIVLAISFSSFSGAGLDVTLGALTGMSMVTLLLPPMLLAIEGLASAYTRSFPMKKRTLISAKTLISLITYVISLMVLFLVETGIGRDFSTILMYGAAHAFSMSAAIMFELTILTNKFWKEGFAVGNIYSRLTTYILILIPGFAIAVLPIVGAFAASLFLAEHLVLAVFLAVALTEFGVMAAVVMRQK